MGKSAKNLDVNIALSKDELIGVAAFERTSLGIQKSPFLHVVACICRNYLQKCNTFKALHAKASALKKSSTFKSKCAVNAENLICNL